MALSDEQEKEINEKLEKALKSVDALTASAAELKTENARLAAKVAEANKHTKAAEKAAEDATKKKAEDDGNFEALFKSSEADRELLQTENDELKNKSAKEKVSSEALRIAGSMAEGENIGLLASFLEPRLKYSDGSVKVTDNNGNDTISTVEDLQKEFTGSARYASLLKGNKSSGGGAPPGGSNNGGAGNKTMKRVEFDALGAVERADFMKKGGTLTDQQ